MGSITNLSRKPRALTRDGVRLIHVEAGPDEPSGPPLLLVHGWACDHSFMAPQLRHFAQTSRVVAVDLRGHGASGAPRHDDYTVAAFVDDLCWQIDQLGLHKPVIIGHSMGGNVALQLAATRPEVPAAIVMIDTIVFPPAALQAGLPQVAEGLDGPMFRDTIIAAGSALFAATDDPDRKAAILERMSHAPRHVALPAMIDHLLAFDSAAAAAGCKVPAAYIAAMPMAELDRFRAACPQLVTGQVLGSGHFPQLEVPDQVNAMIEHFLALLPAA